MLRLAVEPPLSKKARKRGQKYRGCGFFSVGHREAGSRSRMLLERLRGISTNPPSLCRSMSRGWAESCDGALIWTAKASSDSLRHVLSVAILCCSPETLFTVGAVLRRLIEFSPLGRVALLASARQFLHQGYRRPSAGALKKSSKGPASLAI